MCDENNQDDEGSGDQSGQGTPPTLRPPSSSRRDPKAGHRGTLPTEEQTDRPAEPTGDFQRPRLRQLENGYAMVWDGEQWLLFDDEGDFVGCFHDAADAMNEAYRRKPWGRFGM
ncbi:hypothetical protein SR870_06245 [Rhodopseudomonas palustris]|uniref:hypothetical protein n=1 Tax=Rhodopseudomonas palustris TaxID=1076 RepID=UPI002ACE97ED|nr:hypothetical protein [Rhodopseudomonas palustris]WQH00878.1 hypothetical protein SR870_06245 [Rhodopseudomonas palustris]